MDPSQIPATPLPNPELRRESREPADLDDPLLAPRHAQLFMILKATRLCNLRCSYCNAWREGPNQIMPREVMTRAIEQALQPQWVRRVDFVWHGGETTLLPISFFHAALETQAKYQGTRLVANSIQTNATLLDDEWIDLFKAGHFVVGVSVDPPPERHARDRKTKKGRESWLATMDGLRRLRDAGIQHGVLVVVTPELIEYGAQRFLACLEENELTNVALLNVVPDNRAPVAGAEDYLDWDCFVSFLIDVYIEREKHHRGIRIRELDNIVTSVLGGRVGACLYAGNCMGQFLTVEPSGDVSACDKYVNDDTYRFGNLVIDNLIDILNGRRLALVRNEYFDHLSVMAKCPHYVHCHGGCPHDQYLRRKVQPGLVIECCGLKPLIEVIRTHQSDSRGASQT